MTLFLIAILILAIAAIALTLTEEQTHCRQHKTLLRRTSVYPAMSSL